ncbi:MAG: Gfo/Idh/MocA family protein [Acidimicrobiales bacterium]
MPVRVGIIGVGVMGAEHARLLSHEVSGAVVATVFDVDPLRAATVAAASRAEVGDDPMVLIKDDEVDAVVVASSDQTHEPFVLAALAAGKPVLCEKPLTPDLAGCARIVDAEIELGRRLVSVGFMRRYDPGYEAMKHALVTDRIGRPLMLHCTHRNAGGEQPPHDTMLISQSAVHEIDIARWLLDEELVAVTVHKPRRGTHSRGTQDPLFLVFESASGVLVDVEVFASAGYGYDVRCEAVADSGTVSLDAPPPTVLRSGGSEARSVPADWRPRFAEAYRRQLQDWVAATRAGATAGAAATAWDGFVATKAAEVAVGALGSGDRQTMSLPDKPGLYR